MFLRLLFACMLSPVVLAQQPSERWRNFVDPVFYNLSAEQGLPAGRVPGVAIDQQGFMWLATSNGLARWDGVSLSPFESNLSDVDRDMRVLKAGPSKRLWIGTGNTLRRYDPGTGDWREFSLLGNQRFAVTAIDFVENGEELTVWVGTERGVYSVNAASGEVVRYLELQSTNDVTMRVFSILAASNGTVWAGASNGLYRKTQGSAVFKRHNLAPELPPTARIAALVESSFGDIWLSTPRAGVFTIDAADQLSSIAIEDFSGEWIFSMAEVSAGVMWLGSYGRGLIEIDRNTGRMRRMSHLPLLKHSIADNEIWTILADPNGLVWVGTSRGLSVHDLRQQSIQTAFGGSGREGALRDRAVTSLLEMEDGRLLAGLGASGVDMIDPLRGVISGINVDADNPADHLPGGAIEAMINVSDGSVLIGSNWGLYRFDDQQVRRQVFDGRREAVFTGSLIADGSSIWAGGSDGLWRLALSDAGNRAAQVAASVSGDFTDPRISTLSATAENTLAVGTWNGVTWIDPTGEVVDRLPAAGAAQSPLDNGYITSLLTDAEGRTWIGTSGAGIYLRDTDGTLRQFTRQHGLLSDLIGGLLQDRQGQIWASSNGGLAVIDSQDFSVQPLGPADGVMVTPYFRQPALATSQGELLFGGDGGLTIISPDQWAPRRVFAPLAIAGVRVGELMLSAANAGIKKSEPVVVPADDNAVSVEFAALDFLAAKTLRYRHKLVGFDDDWRVSSASSRFATYTSLPPGSYELQLESTNRQGRWGGVTISRFIRVMPLWYQTNIARWLMVILVAVFMMVLLRWRTRQLQRRQLELESLVDLRTRELKLAAAELKEKSAALETASLTDPLTGMNNRRFVEQHLPTDQAMCFRGYRNAGGQIQEGVDLLLFMVDIDHFKAVNDQHGHAAGDAVLAAMPERLLSVFRESDHLVRWGGEEFLVVARSASRAHVKTLARRIASQISSKPFATDHTPPLNLTCSIGYCALPFDPKHPDALGWQDAVRLADMALYAAKRAGRNAWAGIQAGPDLAGASDVRYWLTEPRAALLEGHIELTCSVADIDISQIWGNERG